jgi:hypothetical protein
MRRLVLILCISSTVAQLSNAQRTVTSSPAFMLAHPERANPEKDCQFAIARHDFRFVGVAGFALDVPGVPDYHARYWETNGVKVIGGTGDVGHRNFNEAARAYASRYNAALLKYLATHRSSNAKT